MGHTFQPFMRLVALLVTSWQTVIECLFRTMQPGGLQVLFQGIKGFFLVILQIEHGSPCLDIVGGLFEGNAFHLQAFSRKARCLAVDHLRPVMGRQQSQHL